MDDSGIVELYWQRSEAAIKETEIKYGKLCRRIAMNILQNSEDADECVNDTYLGAWNAIPPQKPIVLSSYLCKITRNNALKKYEYYHAKKRNIQVEISLTELEDCVSGIKDVQYQFEAEHIAKVISDFLRTLNYDNQNVFMRRYWFYDSVSDIASRFAISESKVKSMLFRTRSKLKNCLKKEGIEL